MREKICGYKDLVDNAIQKALAETTVCKAIDFIMTLEGKVPFENAFQSFNSYEKMLYNKMEEEGSVFSIITEENETYLYVLLSEQNKVGFSLSNFSKAYLIGKVLISFEEKEIILKMIDNYKEQLFKEEKKVDSYYLLMTEEKRKDKVKELLWTLKRMNPITFFLNQRVYSNFYDWNNLYLKRKGERGEFLFDKLLRTAYEKWEREDKIFLYSLEILISSGLPSRLDEMSRQQVSLGDIATFFDRKFDYYSKVKKLDKEN